MTLLGRGGWVVGITSPSVGPCKYGWESHNPHSRWSRHRPLPTHCLRPFPTPSKGSFWCRWPEGSRPSHSTLRSFRHRPPPRGYWCRFPTRTEGHLWCRLIVRARQSRSTSGSSHYFLPPRRCSLSPMLLSDHNLAAPTISSTSRSERKIHSSALARIFAGRVSAKAQVPD